jgi:hypothetical protein
MNYRMLKAFYSLYGYLYCTMENVGLIRDLTNEISNNR